MEAWYLGAAILAFAWAGILSARLCCYRKQIRHLRRELEMIEKTGTGLGLTSVCGIGETEEVICAVNRILEKNRETQELLRRENRSYRESIAGISHDIRTPLTSAKGYMQMIRSEKVTDEKRKDYAGIVERRLDDLTGLLDQLFLYTRIESGELSLEIERLNANNLFAETLSLFYEDFLEKGCEPEVFLEQEPCYIRADRQAFVRIIENLIRNALVHGTGGYAFSLRRSGQNIVLSVSNRTDSIEEGDIGRIFERFYTTDVSRSRRTTGLGLAIVKKFAEQMGGEAAARLADGLFTIEVRFWCV